MINGRLAYAMLTAAVSVFGLASQSFADNRSASMVTGGLTSQPIGHYEFCQKYADECNQRSKMVAPPRLTEFGRKLVQDINHEVNNSIIAMTDLDVYGRDEVWEYPTEVGDCEDFVLLKRKKLMEKGFSAADLLITVVRKPDGEGHAVLTLRTSDGDFILDNLEDDVKLWTATDYTFLKRQASFNTGRWITIEQDRDLLVGALK
jgi:predicted transglutaminase-like cysteine proteinase